jgi:hypothetical protein
MNRTLLLSLCLSTLLGLPSVAAAQGGGFTAGDLYLSGNIGLPGPTALVRVDPLSGDSAVLKQYAGISGGQESLAFDPYRQRLILMARLQPSDGILWQPYLVDAAGNFAPLEPSVAGWNGLSPTGDGRISRACCHSAGSTRPTRCTSSTTRTASRPS